MYTADVLIIYQILFKNIINYPTSRQNWGKGRFLIYLGQEMRLETIFFFLTIFVSVDIQYSEMNKSQVLTFTNNNKKNLEINKYCLVRFKNVLILSFPKIVFFRTFRAIHLI